MRRAWWALVIAVPLIFVLAKGFSGAPNSSAGTLVGQRAPTFTLHTLDGRRLSLSSFHGHPVVLNFWASWCQECKNEHPYLLSLERRFQQEGVTMLGVTYNDSAGSARSFIRDRGAPWPALRDPGERTAVAYGVTGVPETFVIDGHGVIRFHTAGPVRPGAPVTPEQLGRQVRRVLQERA